MRHIVHLDADAFFASVEQAADSRLRGKPIAVGGEKRGVVTSASYEARRFGIRTPMPTSRARKLCPQLIVVPGDYEKYERFSQWMFSYAYDFTPDVEVTSIDEGYLDLTSTRKDPVAIAHTLREAIRQSLKITISEGIASNKLVSQIASKLNKPASFAEVLAGNETRFLHPLPNRWLPGVGPATSGRLNAAGLARIGQIAATPMELLEMLVGSQASGLRQYAQGKDDRPILSARPASKSYSEQETFPQDQTDEAFIEATLRCMSDRLMAKVRADASSIRTITVQVRYNDMDEDQCGESLSEPTDLETDIYGCLSALLRKAWRRRVSLRRISLKLSQVHAGLFRLELPLDRSSQQADARRRLAKAVDELRQARGYHVIRRGHDFIQAAGPNSNVASSGGFELRDREPSAPHSQHPRPSSALGAHSGGGPRSLWSAAAEQSINTRLPTPCTKHTEPPPPQPTSTGPSGVASLPRKARPLSPPVLLGTRSFYSFMDSTLSPGDIVSWAVERGVTAVALCDRGHLHGAPAFAAAAKQAGIQPLIGAEICVGGQTLQLYVENRIGYAHLCALLSGPPPATLVGQTTEGLVAVSAHAGFADLFPGRFYLAAGSSEALRRRSSTSLPTVALLPAHYARPADRWKYDVVQSIRTLTLLRQAHPEKRQGGDYHLRSADELRGCFQDHPEAVDHTRILAERCADFSFPFGPPQFPAYKAQSGELARDYLRRLVFEGARRRYPGPRFDTVKPQLETELGIIHDVGYEEYFLVVWDLLQDCRQAGIHWITRGSAADSLVCYCLEISGVCPIRFDLYFRRFLNPERMALNKLPDIDVDFPHDRKDDVVDLLFRKYGPHHCAVVGGFSTFQARSAVGDVAKVLGVSEHQIRRFTEHFPWHFPAADSRKEGSDSPLAERLRQIPECADLPLDEEPYRSTLLMAEFLDGFPRHPKMHPCGVVLSRQPIHELTPTFVSGKGYPTTHYDMDAVEAIGLIKMDILAQGGLAVMREVEQTLKDRGIHIDMERCEITRPAPMHTAAVPPGEPWSDPEVWDLIASGEARAVHHIESPAMINLCRMCQVRELDGLVAIVSVIRPGAANEQKKLHFTRRYQGLEAPAYLHPCLEPCLRSTFGLVVYEEHILQICEAFAGLSGGRADVLRRALVKQKQSEVDTIGREFAIAARARGHSDTLIVDVWTQVTGFSGYAFCKAHSTAYGVEAYQSAWLKLRFPAEFMASVLTQGKGFYNPLVYVLECHRLGISMQPPCVNAPGPGFQVLRDPDTRRVVIRVPVSRIKHLTSVTLERLLRERARCPFLSARDFYLRVRPGRDELEALLQAGAFDGFGQARTTLFWELQQAHHAFGDTCDPEQGWLIPPPGLERLPEVPLTEPTRLQRLQWEENLLGFAASGHPLELHPHIAWNTYCPINQLGRHIGQEVVTCGLVIEQRIHHQVNGEPMKFLTLCDWTGMVETELFAATYRSYGLATIRHPVLEITARVEPFENGRGHTLRVLRAGSPRSAT